MACVKTKMLSFQEPRKRSTVTRSFPSKRVGSGEETKAKKALELAGADASDFNGHSFKIGVASTAAVNGMEDSLIKTLVLVPLHAQGRGDFPLN